MKKYILTFLLAMAIGFVNQVQAQVKPVLPINPTISDIWAPIPDIDTGFVAAASFTIGSKIFVVTGDSSSALALPKHHNRLWQYDTVTKVWSRKANFPGKPRIGAGSFSIGNKGYVGGGRKLWHPNDTMYVLKKLSAPQDTIVVRKDFLKVDSLVRTQFGVFTGVYKNPYLDGTIYQKIDSFISLHDSVYEVINNNTGSVFFVNIYDYTGKRFPRSFYLNHNILAREQFTHTVYRGDSVLKDFWMYDADSNKWTEKAFIPGTKYGRAHPVAFSIKNKGYMGLGYDNDSIKFLGHTINTRVDKWLDSIEVNLVSVGPPAVYKIDTFWRYDTVVISTTTIFTDDIKMMGDLWEYDTATNKWRQRPDYPGPKSSNAIALTLDTTAMVGLGRVLAPNTYLDSFYLYRPSDSSWKRLAPFPSSNRHSVAGFSLGFLGYIVCGNDGLPKRDFYEYNAISNTWDRLPDYPITDSARFFTISGRVGLMGYVGLGSDNKDLFDDLNKWIIDTNRVYIGNRSLSGGSYQPFYEICAGAEFFIKIKKPAGYTGSTILTPQVSDTAGSFFTPKAFKFSTITTTTPDSITLRVILPDTLRSSQKYKIRVNSTNPKITGQPIQDSIFIRALQFVTVEPQTDSTCLTAPAFFSVKVDHDTFQRDTVIYQWRRNGVSLSNGTKYTGVDKDTLFIDNAQLADQGQYDVLITGRCGRTDTSKLANFVVDNISPPTITLQPVSDSVCQTSTKVFTINATGTKPYFRWLKKRNNGKIYDTLYNNPFILGATGTSLTITPTRLSDSGWYRAEVFEECGARIKSDSFKLNFYRVAEIVKQPVNVDSVEFANIGFKVEARGYNLSYQWYRGTTALANSSKYQGVDTDSLTIIDARMTDVGFYNCIITGACGTPAVSLLGLLELDPMPVITQQPDTVTECSGSTIFFSVKVEGANIKYQWRKDNVPLSNGGRITGADERTLIITDIIPGDNGDYDCEVSTGPFTKVISNKGRLTVKSVPAKPIVGAFGTQFIQANISCPNPVYRWYLDNIYEPTLNQQTVQPKKVGDYRVRVTCDGCISELSDAYFWYPTGVDEINTGSVKLYPNPATKEVDVEIPANFAAGTIRIHDMLGKLVTTKTFEAGTAYYKLNISTLSKGMYFVSIESEGNQFVGKLVKE